MRSLWSLSVCGNVCLVVILCDDVPFAAAEQPFKPSAPPRRHCQRPQLVKGKSPQGSRFTVQIQQYLLCFAAQLTSFSSPAAMASRLTSSTLPHVSLGASKSSQVNTLPKAKSNTRSKQNKDMHKCSSVYSERGVPLPVLTSGGE